MTMTSEERIKNLEDESLETLTSLRDLYRNVSKLYEHVYKMKQGSFGTVER
jgi:hypothetical protein